MVKSLITMAAAVMVLFSSATAKATVGFDFAADTQGWKAEDLGNGLPTLTWTSWSGGSLQANTGTMTIQSGAGNNWGKAFLNGDLAAPIDLSLEPLYKLDVFIPNDIYSPSAQLAVRTGSGWQLVESGSWTNLAGGQWNTLTWNMSGIAGLTDVRQLGVEVQGWFPESPNSTTFNIDNAEVTPIPEPASMFLLGTGLAGIFGLRKRAVKQS